MAQAEWGTKRQCPKCSTRFYDLGNDTPVICISCEQKFKPEIVLKSKQHQIELITQPKEKVEEAAPAEEADMLDDEAILKDDEDAGTEIETDDNTTVLSDDDDTKVTDIVAAPVSKGPAD